VLLDSMQEYIGKKGMSPKKAIALTYGDLGGEKDLTDVSTTTALITLVDRYRKASLGMTDSSHPYTDNEMLADQFAGRFGYGDYLVSAVDLTNTIKQNKPLSTLKYFINTMLLITVILIAFLLLGGLFTIVFMGVFITAYVIETFMTDDGSNDNLVYDVTKQRFQRIKNEMVRQLRTMDFDKKMIKDLLISIDNVSKLIELMPDTKPGIISKLYRLVFSNSANRHITLKETDQLIENLQENDLYITSSKLKGLI